jgi:hypothetical protein
MDEHEDVFASARRGGQSSQNSGETQARQALVTLCYASHLRIADRVVALILDNTRQARNRELF